MICFLRVLDHNYLTASYLRLASQPGTGSGAGFEAYFMGTTSVVPGHIVQELCESRGGRPELSGPNEPSGFRGRKELLNRASALVTTCP